MQVGFLQAASRSFRNPPGPISPPGNGSLCLCHLEGVRAVDRLRSSGAAPRARSGGGDGSNLAQVKGAIRMPDKETLQRHFIAGLSQANCDPGHW